MAESEEFKYDPEAGENTKKLRLPFALCKAKGIQIQDWWTPRDAWNALQRNGQVEDVSEEYADYYRKLKRDQQKQLDKEQPWRKAARDLRAKTKKKQLSDSNHNYDRDYIHEEGAIAGAKRGDPMTFEAADSGNVNPYYRQADKETGVDYIGYRTNCQTCVATYIARRKGYDVRALPNLNNKNIYDLSHNVTLAYKDENGNSPKLEKVKDLLDLAAGMRHNEIRALRFTWSGRSNGHVVILERGEKGNAFIYDPQTDTKIEGEALRGYALGKSGMQTMDLTNVSMNEKFCDTIMKKR